MQNTTTCKINVSQASGADVEREISLVGSRSAIEAAKKAIWEKVDAVVSIVVSPTLDVKANRLPA
jgi:far upstream element-binding protein